MVDHTTPCDSLEGLQIKVAKMEEQMRTAFTNIARNEKKTEDEIRLLRADIQGLSADLRHNREEDQNRKDNEEGFVRKVGGIIILALGSAVVSMGVYIFTLMTGRPG